MIFPPQISYFYPDDYTSPANFAPYVYWQTIYTTSIDIFVDDELVYDTQPSNGKVQLEKLASPGRHVIKFVAHNVIDDIESYSVYVTISAE